MLHGLVPVVQHADLLGKLLNCRDIRPPRIDVAARHSQTGSPAHTARCGRRVEERERIWRRRAACRRHSSGLIGVGWCRRTHPARRRVHPPGSLQEAVDQLLAGCIA